MNKDMIADALALALEAKAALDSSTWVNRCPDMYKGENCSITPILWKKITIGNKTRLEVRDEKLSAMVSCVFLEEANKLTNSHYRTIPEWNDTRTRTRKQVKTVYKRTIERLKNAEPP